MTIASTVQRPFEYYLDSAEEKIVFQERTHWIFPFLSCVSIFPGLILFTIPVVFAYIHGFITLPVLFVYESVMGVFTLLLVSKIIIDWYFHMYIFTTKKILEVRFSPFFYSKTNGVLLDQVRVTEIDEKESNILKELLNIGTITITFDRPTREEEFTLENIPNPDRAASKLRTLFSTIQNGPSAQIWYQRPIVYHQKPSARREVSMHA